MGAAPAGDHFARVALAHQGRGRAGGGRGLGPGDHRRSAPPARRARVRGGPGAGAQDLGAAPAHRHAPAARSGRVPRALAPRRSRSGGDRARAARAARAAGRSLRRGARAAGRRRERGGPHRQVVSRRSRAGEAARSRAARAPGRELRPLRAALAQPPRRGGRVHPARAEEVGRQTICGRAVTRGRRARGHGGGKVARRGGAGVAPAPHGQLAARARGGTGSVGRRVAKKARPAR